MLVLLTIINAVYVRTREFILAPGISNNKEAIIFETQILLLHYSRILFIQCL